MELSVLNENLGFPGVLIPLIKKEWEPYFRMKSFLEYDPDFHRIVQDRVYRKDKTINVPTGVLDDQGNATTREECVKVARLPIPIQRIITSRSATFLTGGGVDLKQNATTDVQKSLYDAVAKTWRDNKMDFRNNEIAKTFMSETEVAEIWYSRVNEEDKTVEMKCRVYKPSEGYRLMPVYDSTQDMIAFGLGYDTFDNKGKKTERLDLYTKDELIKYIKVGAVWTIYSLETLADLEVENAKVDQRIKLPYGKIPVVYYCAYESCWQIVQRLIERLEWLVSSFADTNDYNGSPILYAKGTFQGMSSKGEAGKVIEGDENTDLRYITWEGAPEAIKLELETLLKFIYTGTQTPNISFDEMKSIGDISGVAFDRIMIDAHLKAKDYQSGFYGEGIQRRLNFLTSACAAINPSLKKGRDVEITPVFKLFQLNDFTERVRNAVAASGGKRVMTTEQIVEYLGMSNDMASTVAGILAEIAAQDGKQATDTVPTDTPPAT